MIARGFLLIADITGYTRFLTGSELEHAQGVLEDLFAVILERLKAPLVLSNVQGDAFFAFSDDAAAWSPGQIVDSIEALYFGFHERLQAIVDNTTCGCRACSNAGKLDLKFIVHHGEYVSQDIAGRQELTGADVIVLHRLLKNDVAEETGIARYALFTAAALGALDLDELKDIAHPYATEIEDFGRIEGAVVDFGDRWKRHRAESEIAVGEDGWWMEPASRVLPFDAETVWAVFWHPEHRSRWNANLQSSVRVTGDPRRVRAGAVDHCAHGKEIIVLRYVDVRPLRHVTVDVALPMDGTLRYTAALSAEGGGTRITVRWARPEGPNPLATGLLRVIGGLFHRKRIRANMVAELAMLEGYIAENARAPSVAPMRLSRDQTAEAARGLAAGEP